MLSIVVIKKTLIFWLKNILSVHVTEISSYIQFKCELKVILFMCNYNEKICVVDELIGGKNCRKERNIK